MKAFCAKIRIDYGMAFVLLYLVVIGFAGNASASSSCSGTVMFKMPADWTALNVSYEQKVSVIYPIEKDANGYVAIDLSTYAVGQGWARSVFGLSNGGALWESKELVTAAAWNIGGTIGNNETLRCPGAGNTIYIQENPGNPGTTLITSSVPNIKIFRVLPPSDDVWLTSTPVISFDKGFTWEYLKLDPNRCGWFIKAYVDEEPDESALIFLVDAPEHALGQAGVGDVTPIPIRAKFEELGTDEIFMTMDGAVYAEDPGDEGKCSYELAAIIYDTDASVHPYFSCYGGCGELGGAEIDACIGVHTGLVQDILGPDNKPHRSAVGAMCFPDTVRFNQMFNETSGVNEMSCYNLPFTRSSNGKWEFNSDSYRSQPSYPMGGFYPVENVTDADIVAAGGHPWATAGTGPRTKRNGDGPVPVKDYYLQIDPVEGVPLIDLYCKGPGWSGAYYGGAAIDCGGGLFDTDGRPGVWNWDNAWAGQPRNQHFCFESHATFTYKPGQRFTFRGDDDIWVYIGGRLAVDLGGTHLAAPGYVRLDDIKDKDGNALVPGAEYPMDIFFCDRRTTMSNVRISTNIYIQQTLSIAMQPVTDEDGNPSYQLCVSEGSKGSCADLAMGTGNSSAKTLACGDDLKDYGLEISYSILNSKDRVVATWNKTDKIWLGGIDLTDPYNPSIDPDKIEGLPLGRYRLEMSIEGTESKTYMNFKLGNDIDIVSESVVYRSAVGDEISEYYDEETMWSPATEAVAGVRFPVYVTSINEGIVDLQAAAGSSYTLTVPSGMIVYTGKSGSAKAKFPKRVNVTGVDTLWLYLDPADMKNPVEKKTVKLASSYVVEFHLPEPPPVPYPVLADIFDVRGIYLGELDIEYPYYDVEVDYLDGKADSIVVYYNRAFKADEDGDIEDSLPNFICLNWDEENLKIYNLFESGKSTSDADTAVACSYVFGKKEILTAYKNRMNDSTLVFTKKGGFSKNAKTGGMGKVINYATFEGSSGIETSGYAASIADRIAPVIVSAKATNTEDLVELTVKFSEPVTILDEDYSKKLFSFYLTSRKISEDARFTDVSSVKEPKWNEANDEVTVYYDKTDMKKRPAPFAGDYIRLQAESAVWSDIPEFTGEKVRPFTTGSTNWNSPTDYDSKKRLPSSWVLIDGEEYVATGLVANFASSSKSFKLIKMGGRAFAIVVESNRWNGYGESYAIMDLQGRVVRNGHVFGLETKVSVKAPGTYMVQVGDSVRRIVIK